MFYVLSSISMTTLSENNYYYLLAQHVHSSTTSNTSRQTGWRSGPLPIITIITSKTERTSISRHAAVIGKDWRMTRTPGSLQGKQMTSLRILRRVLVDMRHGHIGFHKTELGCIPLTPSTADNRQPTPEWGSQWWG